MYSRIAFTLIPTPQTKAGVRPTENNNRQYYKPISSNRSSSGIWLLSKSRNYATRRNVLGSRPDEGNEFSPIYLILPAALGPGVHSASNRNEYQKQKNNVSGEQSADGEEG
jgi:hypothetical protein